MRVVCKYFLHKFIFLFLSLLLLIKPSYAYWLENGKEVNNSPYAKTEGAFGAKLFFTDKADELFDAWNKEGLTVKVSEVDTFKINQPITALILFSNCTPDAKNMANVSVDFGVFNPRGKLIAKKENIEVWRNRPVLGYRELGLSVDSLKITITNKQSKGEYTVLAIVKDKNAGKTLNLERKFLVR